MIVTMGIAPVVTMAADTVSFKKSPVELIDTGLENMEPYPGPRQAAIWVDDHRLVAGIPLERSAHDPKHIGRTVLYDLDTGKTQELMRYAHPVCWDAKTGNGVVVYYPNPDDTKNQQVIGIRVDQSGAVVERKMGGAVVWWGPSCDVTRERDPNLRDRRIVQLRPEHGYVDLGQQGKGGNEPAVLVRPDGRKIELPLKGRQADGIRYLDFLGQYQLNTGSSCRRQGEKCPPEMYVMNPAGEVTTLTFPVEILNIIPMAASTYVVRGGVLIKSYNLKKPGFFLWRNGTLHELWRPGSAGFMSLQQTEDWGREVMSPDGCKVTFVRGVRPSRVFVFDHCSINK